MNTLKYSLFSAELTVKLWLTFLLLFSATVTSFITISSQSLSCGGWGGGGGGGVGGTKGFHRCYIISKDITLPGTVMDRLIDEQRDEETENVGWSSWVDRKMEVNRQMDGRQTNWD